MKSPTPWWRGASLYQVYPRSFLDANGDGVGDLRGITERLDYVASLGVDGIWISPFFPSPMRDFGYDVSDHVGVDPIFGTLRDLDALVQRAHALGLKVLIDQVWSHTAIEHPWFEQSRQSRTNARHDWYVWADARPDGSPPTNWQSWMGGATWSWEPRRRQYYLHNFLAQMPDLNLHSPAVQDAILAVARFWLDRGVDGFRLDTANYYCHDRSLRDNPPKPGSQGAAVPAGMQRHLYNVCQPETLAFLERVRRLTDAYEGRMAVAEIGSENNFERMLEYTQGDTRLHTAYSFLLLGPMPSPRAIAALMTEWQTPQARGAWPSWALSNHDVVRVATRWANNEVGRTRQLLLLLASLRGTVFVYQGEELGLTESVLRLDQLQDPFGKAHWPHGKGRDGCRTPLPWSRQGAAAGFSHGQPWLPLDEAHRALAIDQQDPDPASTLNLTRRALAMRRARTALRLGEFTPLHVDDELLVFVRRHDDDVVLCAFNFSDQARALAWPAAPRPTALELSAGEALMDHASLKLGPWAAVLTRIDASFSQDTMHGIGALPFRDLAAGRQ